MEELDLIYIIVMVILINNNNVILESILGDCYHIYCNRDYPFSLILFFT